jgi:FKBP-type peptidyl-prolyl cis-trans isomerase (trigger factor)
MPKYYANLKKHSEKNGELELDAEVPVEILEMHMADALAHFAENFEMQGFRKGKVPEQIVRERVGEMALLEDSADEAIRDAIREIATDEKIQALGRPEVVIKKAAPKNPLEFKIRFALIPEVKLPDYKKIGKTIAERKDSAEITEKEIDDAIQRLRGMLVFQPGKPVDTSVPLPEINDEFVKQLGPFENVAAFRVELKKNLAQEKEANLKETKRDEMIKEIAKQSKMKIPALLVDQELQGFIEERDAELERAKLSLEEYLKQVKKIESELENEERALIEDQIKMSLIFAEIRKQEHITPDEKEVQITIAQLKHRYPDRDEASLRQTAEAGSIQKKLFEILEG